jgi:hypothetical protein
MITAVDLPINGCMLRLIGGFEGSEKAVHPL